MSSVPHTTVKIDKVVPLSTSDAKWVALNKIHYTDPNGVARDWEFAGRTTRPEGSDCDGVFVIAILQKEQPELLLQKQFRAPLQKVCIEMPAGLLDPNESIETCALRELKEKTGYIGKIIKGPSPLIFMDPGFCNANAKLVTVTIDMDLPANKNPEPELEPNEFIETFSVPFKSLPETLVKLDAEGYALDSRVSCVAEGLSIAQSLLSSK